MIDVLLFKLHLGFFGVTFASLCVSFSFFPFFCFFLFFYLCFIYFFVLLLLYFLLLLILCLVFLLPFPSFFIFFLVPSCFPPWSPYLCSSSSSLFFSSSVFFCFFCISSTFFSLSSYLPIFLSLSPFFFVLFLSNFSFMLLVLHNNVSIHWFEIKKRWLVISWMLPNQEWKNSWMEGYLCSLKQVLLFC